VSELRRLWATVLVEGKLTPAEVTDALKELGADLKPRWRGFSDLSLEKTHESHE
jgi:hypothetical protein